MGQVRSSKNDVEAAKILAAHAVLNNVPSLNEDFHTHKFQGAKTLIGKVTSKMSV